jgi:hypothetical protein
MSNIQSFMFGLMTAWTPGLLCLVWMFWRAPELE